MRRAQVDDLSQPHRNVYTNPAFETASGNGVITTNWVVNPSAEGTSGVVVVRTNYCHNPNLAINSGGYAVNPGGGAATGAWQSAAGYFGTGFYRATWTVASTGSPYLEYSRSANAEFAAGRIYSFGGYVRTSVAVTVCASVGWANSSGGRISGQDGAGVAVPANKWTYVSMTTSAAPAGTAGAWFDWKVTSGTIPIGGTFDIDGVLIEQGSLLGTYFDGATAAAARINIYPDPSFETANPPGWINNGPGTMAVSTEQKYTGTQSLKVVPGQENWGYYNPILDGSVQAGKTYTFSVYVYSATAQTMCLTNYNTPVLGPSVAVPANTWTRLYLTQTIPAGATAVWLSVRHPDRTTILSTFYMDAYMIEESSILGTYFDGSTAASTGFTYAWQGTSNASPSYAVDTDFTYAWQSTANGSYSEQRGVGVTNFSGTSGGSNRFAAISSTEWSSSGTKSIRIIPLSANDGTLNASYVEINVSGLTVGTTYYIRGINRTTQALAAGYNAQIFRRVDFPGTQPTNITHLTTPTNGANVFEYRGSFVATNTFHGIRFYNGAPAGGGDVWWDELSVTETPITSYFDGSTPAAGDFTYNWTGTANASTSQMRGAGLPGVTSGNSMAIQSSDWSASGSKSLRIVPNTQFNTSSAIMLTSSASGGLERGKTYTAIATRRLPASLTGTLSAYAGSIILVQTGIGTFYSNFIPNNAGIGVAKLVFKIVDDGSSWTLRLGHGGAAGSGDVWWDNFMIVEGDYTGDYIDGTKPFSKWDGTANASTSVGYPPQLLDIAGKPDMELFGAGSTTNPVVDGFVGRTIYMCYDVLTNDVSWQVPLFYGSAAPTTGLTFQTNAAGINSMVPRFDFTAGGGDINKGVGIGNSRIPGRVHVMAVSLNQGLTLASFSSNGVSTGTLALNPGTVGFTSGQLRGYSLASIKNIRAMVYYADHDAATRQAVSRYLGNKYGANVA